MEIEEQHPIPQQVSSYQFKLVGDMTLQQFFQVAGGALVALFFYSSSLPSYVKWPLILFSFLTGVAMAFFPLEDRPLAKWIVLFIKAIYSPTIYAWKQMPVRFSYFQAETSDSPVSLPSKIPPAQTSPQQAPQQVSDKLESEEKKFLEKVTKDLEIPSTQPIVSINSAISKTQANRSQFQNPIPKTAFVNPQSTPQIQIPISDKISAETQIKPQAQYQSSTTRSSNYKLSPSAGQKFQNVQGAKFSSEASPPLPPTKANIIVGQVVDSEGKIVENAILEIRDAEGRPARALRSNKLGHFMIVTPLANGVYQITTEKEGLIFDTLSLDVKGEIIPPIAIWAKGKVQTKT